MAFCKRADGLINFDGLPNEAEGIWIGMIIGITISAILNTGRLKYKKGLLKKLS